MKIILASKSKRRCELLNLLNLNFQIIESLGEEKFNNKLSAFKNCQMISYQKAKDVLKRTKGDRIIISCDTIVIKDNKIYLKPKNRDDAYNMLKSLSGAKHQVISCLTVIKVKNDILEEYKTYDKGYVYLDNLTDLEIYDWIDNNNPYDKAGGYAIQESFGKHINKIAGDYYSVVGLPINKLYNILKKINK